MQNPEPLYMIALMRNRSFYVRTAGVLTKEFFPYELEPLFKGVSQYWKSDERRMKTLMPLQDLHVLARKATNKKSWPLVRGLCEKVGKYDPNPPRKVVEAVQSFLIHQGMSRIALDISTETARNNGLDPKVTKQRIEKLIRLGEVNDDGAIEYGRAPATSILAVSRGRIPTGFAEIDFSIGGGLGTGELGVVVAPFGGGKTAILVNIGSRALLQGRSVLHISLEIHSAQVLMRYDMNIGGFTTPQIMEQPSLVLHPRRRVQKAKGALWVYDRSHERLTPLGVERLIEQIDHSIDLVILDYADLVRPDEGVQGPGFEEGQVYRDLRRIASKFNLPVWTASQANREAAKTETWDLSNISRDIAKIETADVGICAVQTKIQKAAKQMTLLVGKTRMSSSGAGVTVAVDYDTMRFHPLKESERVTEKIRKVMEG